MSSFAAILLCGCGITDPEQTTKEQAVKANQLMLERKYSEAELAYKDAIEKARSSDNALQYPLMLRELAKCYFEQQKYDECEAALQQALNAYDDLEKQTNIHFDRSTVRERRHETLVLRADCLMANGKFAAAKDAYSAALASGKEFVETQSTAANVTQKYIQALRKCGQTELADRLELQVKASACTLDDFDHRLGAALALMYTGQFAAAEKELSILDAAASSFQGVNPRKGRVLTLVGLSKLTHNEPVEAQVLLEEALRNSKSFADPLADLSGDYALLGLAKEFRGDTASGINDYKLGFKIEPFHPASMLSLVASGLQKNGQVEREKTVLNRIRWFRSDPQFKIQPSTTLQYVQLANEQQRNDQSELSDQTRLKALQRLESSKTLTADDEIRGAFQLFKFYRKAKKPDLARRSLKQMRLVGERTAAGRAQLKQALRYEQLPDD